MFKRHIEDCEFDIENFNCFSIERRKNQTLICYRDENNDIAEFTLESSPEKHQDFVNRFRAKLQIVKT